MIAARGGAELFLKGASQMALIGEAGHLRRIGATKEITAEYRRFEKKDAMPAKVTEE